MIRFALVVALLLGVLTASIPVSAQNSEPANPKVGEAATIYGANGEPTGDVTVNDIVDPFTDYDVVYSPPSRGYRWVKVSITFTAGNSVLPVNSNGFQIVDSDGYIAYQTYIYRGQESTTAEPDLSVSQVEAGQTASGAIFFQVFGGSTISTVEYSPSYEQTIIAADLRDAGVQAGDVLPWTTTDGSVVGEVSVAGVVDPLEDYDPSYAPQRGFRYVGVAIVFNNTGTRPVTIDSSRFSIVDHEGFVTSSSGIYRTSEGTASLPDFPYSEVAPGGQSSGVVSFQLINGANVKAVIFAPSSDRRVRIAEYAKDATFIPPVLTPVAPADPACEAVLAWAQEVTTALSPAAPTFELIEKINDGGVVTAAEASAAAQTLNDLADAIEALDTPEAARATADQFAGVIRSMAEQMSIIAEALEAGDQEAVTAAATEFYNLAFSLTGGAYSELLTRCPGLDNI